MFVGKMEISEEFAADLLEDLRQGATAAFRRSLSKIAIDHATRDLDGAKPRRAPDLNETDDEGGE